MPYEMIQTNRDTIYLRISGVMMHRDQQAFQDAAGKIIAEGKKVKLLAVLEDFQGWEQGADWGDVGFLLEHGNEIVKMAFVGDEKWKERIFAFVGKGYRSTEIEYFPPSSLKDAEIWVGA